MNKRNSETLQVALDKAMVDGEVPYQANRHALRFIGILGDGDSGIDEVRLMLRGIDVLMDDLKELKRVSDSVVARVSAIGQ